MRSLLRRRWTTSTTILFPFLLERDPEKGGLWVAVFTDPDGRFRGRAKRLIQITDLSVSYKMSSKSLLLWVTSIHTGQPLVRS